MDNKDSAWKEAIETYFPDFIKFFFPNIAKDIDFEKGYEFLNRIFHIRTSPILIVSTEYYFLFLKLFSFFLVATCVSR